MRTGSAHVPSTCRDPGTLPALLHYFSPGTLPPGCNPDAMILMSAGMRVLVLGLAVAPFLLGGRKASPRHSCTWEDDELHMCPMGHFNPAKLCLSFHGCERPHVCMYVCMSAILGLLGAGTTMGEGHALPNALGLCIHLYLVCINTRSMRPLKASSLRALCSP